MFCGEGTLQQNDHAEMQWIFGGNEPDMEPPTATIVNPPEDITIDEGGSVNFRAMVDDNYGGFGWRFVVTKDGETIHDEPDYDREVDEDYLAALNLVNLEPGVYTIMVEVEDQFEHIASDIVTVTVQAGAGSGSASDSDTNGSATATDGGSASGSETEGLEGSDTEGGGSSDEDDDGGTDSTIPEDTRGDDKACACTTGPTGAPAGLLALFALGLVRRRRSRTR
jgi:MYXO-CTERM domain-containing protein